MYSWPRNLASEDGRIIYVVFQFIANVTRSIGSVIWLQNTATSSHPESIHSPGPAFEE